MEGFREELLTEAEETGVAVSRTRGLFVIDDDVAGAGSWHMASMWARRYGKRRPGGLLGPDKDPLGVSAHNPEGEGKPGKTVQITWDALQLCDRNQAGFAKYYGGNDESRDQIGGNPVVAIGGITEDNILS